MTDVPQFAWLKWYPRDFASSTRGWPLVARAVFRELLDAQWDAGGMDSGVLPDDAEQLRDIARATVAEWTVAWRFVARKFPRVKGGRQNARLEEHRRVAVREYLGRRKGAEGANESRRRQKNAARALSERSANAQRPNDPTPQTLSERSASIQRYASSSSAREEPQSGGLRRGDGTESEGKTLAPLCSESQTARNGGKRKTEL